MPRFFLPAPSLMVVTSFSRVLSPFIVGVVGAMGTTLGELTGYLFGRTGRELSGRFAAWIDKMSNRIKRQNAVIFLLAMLPLPLFDFIGVYSGAKEVPLLDFSIWCFAGKLAKMLFFTCVVGQLMETILG